MPNTTVSQNNEPIEVSELLHETKPTQMVVPLKETEKTWTTEFPFLKEEPLLSQIYVLYPNLQIEALVETQTEVWKANEVKKVNNETCRQRQKLV